MKTQKRTRSRITIAAAAAAAAGLALAPLAPASASPTDSADRTSGLIQSTAPNQGKVLPARTSGSAFTAGTGTSMPASPASPVTIDSGDGAASGKFEVKLPKEVSTGAGSVADDGTVVYHSKTDNGADAAVQSLADGSVRMQTIIPNAKSSMQFTYELGEGYTAVLDKDGNAAALKELPNGDFDIVKVDKAWAKDANGKSVPTHYEIENGNLVQVVEPTPDTAYPVVADPKWKWYAAAYGLKFNMAETKDIATSGSAAAACVATGPLAPACGTFAGFFLASANKANNHGDCIFLAAVPVPISYIYNDGDCG